MTKNGKIAAWFVGTGGIIIWLLNVVSHVKDLLDAPVTITSVLGSAFHMLSDLNDPGRIFFLIGIVGLAFASSGWWLPGLGRIRDTWPSGSENNARPIAMGGDSYNNSGTNLGHMGPINNYGNQKLVFTSEVGSQLLAVLPEKKPIDLRTIGSASDQVIGTEVENFLKQNGYSVGRAIIGMMAPPPDHKIHVTDAGQSYIVMVAPSA